MIPNSLCFQQNLIEFRAFYMEIQKEGSQNFEALIPAALLALRTRHYNFQQSLALTAASFESQVEIIVLPA